MNYDTLFNQFPYLQTKDIVLKKVELSDLNELFEIYSNENLYSYKPGNVSKTISAVENIIGHFSRDFKKKKTIFLGIYLKEASDKLVGIAEIFDSDRKVDFVNIGYTLNQDYWGKGIATETTAILLDYLFKIINVNRIQAYVMTANTKSQNVLRRNDFIKEGTIRQGNIWTGKGIVDLELYAILRTDYNK